MDYWKQTYGERSKDFIEGIIAAIEAFSIWKDGVQRIGCMDTPIKEAIQEAKEGLGWKN
jgi:hypothetical protein